MQYLRPRPHPSCRSCREEKERGRGRGLKCYTGRDILVVSPYMGRTGSDDKSYLSRDGVGTQKACLSEKGTNRKICEMD